MVQCFFSMDMDFFFFFFFFFFFAKLIVLVSKFSLDYYLGVLSVEI